MKFKKNSSLLLCCDLVKYHLIYNPGFSSPCLSLTFAVDVMDTHGAHLTGFEGDSQCSVQ